METTIMGYIGFRVQGLGSSASRFILRLYWDYIGVILGLYWDYIGVILGLYRDNGKQNGNYYTVTVRV